MLTFLMINRHKFTVFFLKSIAMASVKVEKSVFVE